MNLHDPKLTPEQVKQIKTINELRAAVKSDHDHIGLMGNQPSLRKIRTAYQADEISDTELELVLTALYNTTGGEPEPFKDAKDFYNEVFAGTLPTKKKFTPTLSVAEQAAAIKDIMPQKKKYSGPRRKAKKKEVKIDVSVLPPELRKYL